jgi:hypothetical protein
MDRRGPAKVWALLAFCSCLWILYHLPVGSASRIAVTGACLVCLGVSVSELVRDAADIAFDRRTRQRVIEPIVLDIRFELDQARTEPSGKAATWILVRGIWSLCTAVVASATTNVLARIWNISGLE